MVLVGCELVDHNRHYDEDAKKENTWREEPTDAGEQKILSLNVKDEWKIGLSKVLGNRLDRYNLFQQD